MSKDVRNYDKFWYKKQLSMFSAELTKDHFDSSDQISKVVTLPAGTWVEKVYVKTIKVVTGPATLDIGWEGTGNGAKLANDLTIGTNAGDIVATGTIMPVDIGDFDRDIIITLNAALTAGEIRVVIQLLETTTSIYDKFRIQETPGV